MKTSIISLFALASSFVGVLAAPTAAPAAEIEVRKSNDVAQAQAIVNDLSTTLQPMLAAISTYNPLDVPRHDLCVCQV